MSPTAYDSWLVNIREDHDSLPSIEEQQAFLDFINHKTSADEAASAYTHVETNRKHPNADSLWLLLWLAAGEWPETHEHLIELLKAIKRLPPVSRGDNKEEGSATEYWSALPYFEFGLREYWDGELGPRKCTIQRKHLKNLLQEKHTASSMMQIRSYILPSSTSLPSMLPFSATPFLTWRHGL